MLIAKELNDVPEKDLRNMLKNFAADYEAEPDQEKRNTFIVPNLMNVVRNLGGEAEHNGKVYKVEGDKLIVY